MLEWSTIEEMELYMQLEKLSAFLWLFAVYVQSHPQKIYRHINIYTFEQQRYVIITI